MNILEIENVSKHYAGHTALDNVSLSIPQGSVYGLLGPNGAGKTTLIRIINHITAPDSGRVLFDGHQLSQNDVSLIGYLPEERGLYKKMKVGEQAMFFAKLKGLSGRDARLRLKEWFDRFEITSWWDKKVEELSKGMAQKIQFIITVLHEPKLLIFDEPFSGFDPINANLLKNEILNLRDKGATVIFSTHNMSSVEAVCDNITLINASKNILTGNVADIRNQLGANRYRITVIDPVGNLLAGLGNMLLEHKIEKTDGNSTTLIVKADPAVTRRELLGRANDAADVTLFAPALPSMDEVFITTVEQFNKNKK
ncbi:MAG: ATP-binding cassette domain-containing protein [Muribaculaceae bacterium]|nr:ATP-binding cassette domain-containing protein [Muribaculaceae bacterium]